MTFSASMDGADGFRQWVRHDQRDGRRDRCGDRRQRYRHDLLCVRSRGLGHEVSSAIEREPCTGLPPLPPGRRRIVQRHALSHDQRRKYMRWYGFVDPQRTWRARIAIGNASWCTPFWGIFGDLNAALHYLPCRVARILKFPERRSDIAKLKAEIAEMSRIVSAQ
jgi:hypothetical protein